MNILKRSRIIFIFLLAAIASNSHALVCPDKSKAPKCPTSGTTLLDETYPTQSFVISNDPMISSRESSRFTKRFIQNIISSYEFKNIPQIILKVKKLEEFNDIKNEIKVNLISQKLSEQDVASIMAQFTHMPADKYTWQQDWFESFVNLKTGSPEVRYIESYSVRIPESTAQKLATAGDACDIQKGKNLATAKAFSGTPIETVKNLGLSFGSSETGGNIEGAPGGFCLLGDNMGKKFAKDVCGDEKNIIRIQTSWLSVGHVDEIFKIIPTQFNDGRPKECEFSLMAASPMKAFELMNSPLAAKSSFFDVGEDDVEGETEEFRKNKTREKSRNSTLICNYIQKIMQKKGSEQPSLSPQSKTVLLRLFGISDAVAQTQDPFAQLKASNCAKNLDQVTNKEMKEVMNQDVDVMLLNQAITNSIEIDKKVIQEKILSRLPQCAKYYDEMDVPNIFFGQKSIMNAQGQLELIKPGIVDSLLPNPTNSVLMNKTLTIPDSGNSLFNDYIAREVAKRKMKSDFLASWDYAHVGLGNIHCASHSITYCQP